ncbi:MAG: hypothetical protein IIA14_01530 [SAR324 cluster bacterium]|nr:hypothetical protein [SAR324 cluster bacterium]
MYLFAYLNLDQFYIRGRGTEQAVVVHQDREVLDCNGRARARGVRPGSSLAEAKATLRGEAEFVRYVEGEYIEARDRWLDTCLLFSNGVEHESPASAWIDLSAHPDPGDTAARMASELWTRHGCPVSLGLAPAKWIAKIATQKCDPETTDVALVRDTLSYLTPLPTALLTPVPRAHRERLVFLGYRRIGDVRRAPLSALVEQFGNDGLLVHEAVHGRLCDRVRPNYPLDSVYESRRFEDGAADRLALEQALRSISAKLADDLQSRDRSATEFHLLFELESGRTLKRVRKLPRPTQGTRSVQAALHYMLSQTEFDERVVAVRATAPQLKRSGAHQLSIEHKTSEIESMNRAVRNLHAVFGAGSLQRASDVEPPRREKLLRAWKHATGWR